MMGAQASAIRSDKILAYMEIGVRKAPSADRRRPPHWTATWPAATTSSRPCSRATTKMRIFQEEIFGPVLA